MVLGFRNPLREPILNPTSAPNPNTLPNSQSPSGSSQQVPVVKRRRFKHKAQKGRGSPGVETSEESPIPEAPKTTNTDATATAVPGGVEAAGIPITQIVDGGQQADKDSDSEDNMPLSFCVKRRVQERSADVPKTPQTKRLKDVTTETFERMGLTIESAKKRRADGDLSPMKVYEKKRSRRSLSQSVDTQEPGTQSVSDIQASPIMDPQEPGAQSVPDIQPIEVESTDAAAQGTSPDKAVTTNEQAIPDSTAILDKEGNPDKGTTPDEEPTSEAVTNTGDATIAVEEATQEPFTQSVEEGLAPQEPSCKFSNLLSFISRIIC